MPSLLLLARVPARTMAIERERRRGLSDVGTSEGIRTRIARPGDRDAIETLMRVSIQRIFPSFYREDQTRSSVEHIGRADGQLLDDGTYFVVEESGELIACGGWSRRDKLFSGSSDQEGRARLLDPETEPARVRAMFVRPDRTRRGLGTIILQACEDAARGEGFRRLSLMATLPGIPLYERFGFRVLQREVITLPDGITLATASMDKQIGRA